jgi:hypothetical protein
MDRDAFWWAVMHVGEAESVLELARQLAQLALEALVYYHTYDTALLMVSAFTSQSPYTVHSH